MNCFINIKRISKDFIPELNKKYIIIKKEKDFNYTFFIDSFNKITLYSRPYIENNEEYVDEYELTRETLKNKEIIDIINDLESKILVKISSKGELNSKEILIVDLDEISGEIINLLFFGQEK